MKCLNGKEFDILDENIELVDVDFIFVLMEVG